MKKFIIYLLMLLPLLSMAQLQSPEYNVKSSTNSTGYLILKPVDYDPIKSYPAIIWLHGAAGRGDGSKAGLDNVLSQVPSELQKGAARYQWIIVALQYSDGGSNAVIDHVYSKTIAIPGVDPRRIAAGSFSMGGGVLTRYISSSQENADKFSVIISVAGLNQLVSSGVKYITQSKLPVLFFHAQDDNQASPSNSMNGISSINALSPVIPAKGIFYTSGGHDVTNRVFNADQFPWTGNEVLANIYDYALSLKNDSPAIVPVTSGPVFPVALADDFTTSTSQIQLIGNKSRNAIADKSKWSCIAAPSGVSIYAVNGCGYISCDKVVLPAEGVYKFRLTVADAAGNTAYKDITVTYNKSGTPQEPEPPVTVKVIVGRFFYGGWELVIYNDGSAEKK